MTNINIDGGCQDRSRFVASCSGGKDSVATLLLTALHGEPLDEVICCEVMFDATTSGEIPEHREFIYNRLKPFCEQELGCKFTVLRSEKTYSDTFHHIICRGNSKGQKCGFAMPQHCAVNRDCKVRTLNRYNAMRSKRTVNYIGIAADEPKRLARLDGVKEISLLAKYGYTEADAVKLCEKYGLLSPVYSFCKRNGCWFCPNASDRELHHLLLNHPHLFHRLIIWEQEPNLRNYKFNRRETPSQLKNRLLATKSTIQTSAGGGT